MTDKEKLEEIEKYVDLRIEACKQYFDDHEENLYDEVCIEYNAERSILIRIKNILEKGS